MNSRLQELYKSKWTKLVGNSKGTNASYPLLIKVHNEYQTADIKIMIVGQETDGWCGQLEQNDQDICSLREIYFDYFHNSSDKNKRPFWNRKNFKYFQEQLTQVFADKKVACIWNNVSKMGVSDRGGRPGQEIEELESKYFDVFEEELRILQPDIIIFTTGDRTIPVDHERTKSVGEEKVSEIKFKNYPSIYALRTYHPNAQIKGGKSEFKKRIVDLIKQKYNNTK